MDNNKITLAFGNGGIHTHNLINEVFMKNFNNEYLNKKNDSSVIEIGNVKFAFTTDSYVVKPIFFPGGDIGKLAVTGTVNDLAVMGAKPKYLSVGMIIEEGFEISELEKIVKSMKKTADDAGVLIVTGDTKVVEKGSCDNVFINTSGIGVIENNAIDFSINKINLGDEIIINGSIGDHGITILNERENFPIEADIKSDCECLNGMINEILENVPCDKIKIMRDPTRGGLATTLNEFVENKNISIEINEEDILVKDEVRAICEITGFDPLYVANEGKIIIVCDSEYTEKILKIMKGHPAGKDSVTIGKVVDADKGNVILNTSIGGKRIIDMLRGDMLPRIC